MRLVVSVGRAPEDCSFVEEPLKRYMLAMSCPVGMLIVPSRIWIYRNRYLSSDPRSVEKIGPFVATWWPESSLPTGFVGTPEGAAAALDPFVQEVRRWLEGLDTAASVNALPSDLRTAVREYILPVLTDGILRAGVPRQSA